MKNRYFYSLAGTIFFASSAAMAAGAAQTTLDNLPDEGQVTLKGVISELDDRDTFILEDSAGNTIDVHTRTPVSLKVGDSVTVTGKVEDELLGMGQEIADATIVANSDQEPSSMENMDNNAIEYQQDDSDRNEYENRISQ